jgi:hypothetical protein|tara:strand:+ start:162 stop:386 length:225 start_codon:yes stop_codon:yes gene_type:complete
MNYERVKDHSDLVRDPETGSIINVNSLDYEKYVARRKIKNEKKVKTMNMEEDLARLKDEMNEIKSLLKELVNGN